MDLQNAMVITELLILKSVDHEWLEMLNNHRLRAAEPATYQQDLMTMQSFGPIKYDRPGSEAHDVARELMRNRMMFGMVLNMPWVMEHTGDDRLWTRKVLHMFLQFDGSDEALRRRWFVVSFWELESPVALDLEALKGWVSSVMEGEASHVVYRWYPYPEDLKRLAPFETLKTVLMTDAMATVLRFPLPRESSSDWRTQGPRLESGDRCRLAIANEDVPRQKRRKFWVVDANDTSTQDLLRGCADELFERIEEPSCWTRLLRRPDGGSTVFMVLRFTAAVTGEQVRGWTTNVPAARATALKLHDLRDTMVRRFQYRRGGVDGAMVEWDPESCGRVRRPETTTETWRTADDRPRWRWGVVHRGCRVPTASERTGVPAIWTEITGRRERGPLPAAPPTKFLEGEIYTEDDVADPVKAPPQWLVEAWAGVDDFPGLGEKLDRSAFGDADGGPRNWAQFRVHVPSVAERGEGVVGYAILTFVEAMTRQEVEERLEPWLRDVTRTAHKGSRWEVVRVPDGLDDDYWNLDRRHVLVDEDDRDDPMRRAEFVHPPEHPEHVWSQVLDLDAGANRKNAVALEVPKQDWMRFGAIRIKWTMKPDPRTGRPARTFVDVNDPLFQWVDVNRSLSWVGDIACRGSMRPQDPQMYGVVVFDRPKHRSSVDRMIRSVLKSGEVVVVTSIPQDHACLFQYDQTGTVIDDAVPTHLHPDAFSVRIKTRDHGKLHLGRMSALVRNPRTFTRTFRTGPDKRE